MAFEINAILKYIFLSNPSIQKLKGPILLALVSKINIYSYYIDIGLFIWCKLQQIKLFSRATPN